MERGGQRTGKTKVIKRRCRTEKVVVDVVEVIDPKLVGTETINEGDY